MTLARQSEEPSTASEADFSTLLCQSHRKGLMWKRC